MRLRRFSLTSTGKRNKFSHPRRGRFRDRSQNSSTATGHFAELRRLIVSSYLSKAHVRDFLQNGTFKITKSCVCHSWLLMSPNIVPTKHNYSSMAQNTAPATQCRSAMCFPFIRFNSFLSFDFPPFLSHHESVTFPFCHSFLVFLSVTFLCAGHNS